MRRPVYNQPGASLSASDAVGHCPGSCHSNMHFRFPPLFLEISSTQGLHAHGASQGAVIQTCGSVSLFSLFSCYDVFRNYMATVLLKELFVSLDHEDQQQRATVSGPLRCAVGTSTLLSACTVCITVFMYSVYVCSSAWTMRTSSNEPPWGPAHCCQYECASCVRT